MNYFSIGISDFSHDIDTSSMPFWRVWLPLLWLRNGYEWNTKKLFIFVFLRPEERNKGNSTKNSTQFKYQSLSIAQLKKIEVRVMALNKFSVYYCISFLRNVLNNLCAFSEWITKRTYLSISGLAQTIQWCCDFHLLKDLNQVNGAHWAYRI